MRFSALSRALSDVLWVRVAERIPFLLRVTPREAEENFRRIRVAARLNPANAEPYRYGTLGLSLWGRNDLALRLAREGLDRHPSDQSLMRSLYIAISLSERVDPAQSVAALRPVIDGPVDEMMSRFLYVLLAQKQEEAGLKAEALTTWRLLADRFPDEAGILATARQEVKRLESEAGNRASHDSMHLENK